MTDRADSLNPAAADPARPTTHRPDSLREAREPLKQEGDALQDGSGSRNGQSPAKAGEPGASGQLPG